MTFFEDLKQVSDELDSELATKAVLTPMIRPINGRLRPDASRAEFETSGIFHEYPKSAGDGRYSRDGLNETIIKSVVPSISINTLLLKWRPTQGDEVYLPELGRRFRILDVELEMHTRTRFLLENMDPNPAS